MTKNTDRAATPGPRRRVKKAADGSAATAEPSAAAAVWPPSVASEAPTKSASVIKLLLRARGATSLELVAATDWQPHSIRAFLSGLRKKGRVLVRKERKGDGFAYHMQAAAAADEQSPPAGSESGSPAGDAA